MRMQACQYRHLLATCWEPLYQEPFEICKTNDGGGAKGGRNVGWVDFYGVALQLEREQAARASLLIVLGLSSYQQLRKVSVKCLTMLKDFYSTPGK